MQKEYKINQVNPSKGALDFSYLLDAPAGKHGFVQAKNGHLYYEDGTRARFLGFNMATRSNAVNHELAEKLAGRFASLGVNVIRLHAADAPIGEQERSWSSCKEAPLLDYEKGTSRFFHPEGLDRFDYFVAKLKEKGIYIHIDLIVAREFLLGDELDYDTKVASCSKCYPMFNERLIELQQEFAKEFLTHVNPYTGLALVDEPAVITVQINNEESAIKGTMDNDWNPAMQPYRDEVQRKWNHFLLSKYDTRDRLEKAWTWDEKCGLKEEEDPTQNSVEIVHGNFYQPVNDPNADWDAEVSPARYADYMEFGIAQNRRFYSRMKAFLKGIGVKVPIVASNLVAGAADVYGHIDGDIMENNCYFNHPLFPLVDGGYNIVFPNEYVGVNPLTVQTYVGAMANTILSMGAIAATEGKPFMVSEWNEYGLVPFHSTAFMHTVAYACLNDWDGLILYNYQTSEKENEPEDEILSVFDAYNDPSLICQWGMMAEVFLKGLVSPARNQVDLVYTQNDLKTLPNMMAAPIMYLPYVTRMRNVFLDGDTYGGKAKVAVNAGFVNDGNLENAEHGVYYAWSDYADIYRNGLDVNRLVGAAKDTKEVAYGIHLGKKNLVIDHMQELAGTGNYIAFATYLDQALKTWNILDEKQGLVDGSLVSDTGELTFSPDQKQFWISTENFAYFSGMPSGDILLSGDICVKPKNERITLASLKRNKSGIEGKTEFLLVALSDTGMTETKSEQGDMMMGMPVTHITMKGKLYVNTLEGELWLPGRTAKLELLSQEGEVLATYDGESQDGNVKFVLGGEIPSTQYRLVVER